MRVMKIIINDSTFEIFVSETFLSIQLLNGNKVISSRIMNEYYYNNHVKKFGPIIAEVNDEFIEKCYKNALEMNEIGKIFDEKMFYTKDELNKINFNKASSLYYNLL